VLPLIKVQQEVLYLFAAITARLEENFPAAHEYVNRSLLINPEYSRALHVQGNIYLDEGKVEWDNELIDQALASYENAIIALDKPDGSLIDDRISISIGNIYVIRAQQSGDPNSPHFERSRKQYQKVIDRYDPSQLDEGYQQRLRSLAAISYFGLGVIYEKTGLYPQAIEAYNTSVELAIESAPDPQVKDLPAMSAERLREINGSGN